MPHDRPRACCHRQPMMLSFQSMLPSHDPIKPWHAYALAACRSSALTSASYVHLHQSSSSPASRASASASLTSRAFAYAFQSTASDCNMACFCCLVLGLLMSCVLSASLPLVPMSCSSVHASSAQFAAAQPCPLRFAGLAAFSASTVPTGSCLPFEAAGILPAFPAA